VNPPAIRHRAGHGVEHVPPRLQIRRSQNIETSVIVVLRGSIEQACHRARERLGAGTMAIRPLFDCQSAHSGPLGAELLHLPWAADLSLGASYEGLHVDRVRSMAAVNPDAARYEIETFVRSALPRPGRRRHLVDDLRAGLIEDPNLCIGDWAQEHEVSREGLSRSFTSAYQVPPARFRMEVRARLAWVRVVSGREPLAAIADEIGFANPAHMTRDVHWLTGHPPSAWRAFEDRRGGGLSRSVADRSALAPYA
jgi:AraC-like DNA-binding protein